MTEQRKNNIPNFRGHLLRRDRRGLIYYTLLPQREIKIINRQGSKRVCVKTIQRKNPFKKIYKKGIVKMQRVSNSVKSLIKN